LLVDGLDEIQNDADRSTFVDHLETFLSDYSNIRMVVTSREAGFSLVAPSIARFCSRWRVAPLEESAIELLCVHWHTLMKGPSNDSFAEARDVAERLLQNDSLRRLAENPLLLTMLLVVKHGAGQLPPDRVSLYERAVEVLLDTWNIKGHEPLNLKEAVPQLAYVAFELMRKGAQTATEKELLLLLEEAREKVPQIQRYAKDTPDKFLKRVELRSSLLVEAGHQLEGTRTVPFYQFRHLTFQEFLAAVAAVDGHYVGYKSSDTILTPLKPYVTAHEWKEVIPMAAVRAKKQAEPLMIALVDEINCLREALENSDLESNELSSPDSNVDEEGIPAVTRLVQCLAEEAEASPSTLTTALQLIVLFARGCHDTEEGWQAIVRGPYGAELLHQAWLQYLSMQWPRRSHLPVTFARLLEFRKPLIYWHTKIGKLELEHALRSVDEEEITRALLTLVSMCWRSGEGSDVVKELLERKDFFEYHLFSNRRGIWDAAAWGWALSRRSLGNPEPPIPVLDHLLALWLGGEDKWGVTLYALAHGGSGLRTRRSWQPVLTAEQKDFVRQATNRKDNSNPDEGFVVLGALVVAFYAQNIWPDKELHEKFINVGEMEYREIDYKFMVAQLVP